MNDEYWGTTACPKKYILYNINEDGTLADIIDVEYGGGIDSAFKQFSLAIRDDLMERKEYKDCSINVFRRGNIGQNRYAIDVAVIPPYAQSNIIVSYQVVVRDLV